MRFVIFCFLYSDATRWFITCHARQGLGMHRKDSVLYRYIRDTFESVTRLSLWHVWVCDTFESVTRLSQWHSNTVSVGPAHTLCQLTLVTLGVHIQLLCNSTEYYLTVGNFRGRNFRGFVTIWESFLPKFGGLASFGSTSEQSTKVFFAKLYFPPIG